MKSLFALAAWAFLGAQAMLSPVHATIVNAPVDSADYITIDGLDWAWAAPCNPVLPSCGVIDLTFQGPLGWSLASTSQIDGAIATAGGLANWVNLFQPSDICASRFFNNSWSHCDYGDALDGYIYNYSGNVDGAPGRVGEEFNEVFAVRGQVAVPAPDGLPLFILGIALTLLGARKRFTGRA